MGKTLAQVQVIHVGVLGGAPGFGHKLIGALQRLGRFEFTADRAYADAVLEAHGADTDDGFVGTAMLRDMRGSVLWHGHAFRPHGVSGPMAYERLVEQLTVALEALDQSRVV
jgi:hypothetical protein